jgi:hypothetical protein
MVDPTDVAYDAIREIYDEAEPGLDFDEVLNDPDEFDDDWYSQHYLPDERQREILNKHLDKHDLSDKQESSVTITVILWYGPVGHEKPEEIDD